MPKLKRYADGRGFYLIGHVPGAGYCTWQIQPEGLAYLGSRGVSAHGDAVRLEDLRYLLDRRLVGTGQGGTGRADCVAATEWMAELVKELEQWAAEGGFEALTQIVCARDGVRPDYRPTCFSASFLRWAAELDPEVGLPRMAGISASEFETLASGVLTDPDAESLLEALAARGSIGVIWRLARLAGGVAVQLRTGPNCPPEWGSQPLLSWLFGQLKELQAGHPRSQSQPRPRTQWVAPRVFWEVDLQQVVAVLPAQPVVGGAAAVSWWVGDGQAVHPLVRAGRVGREIEESESDALPPAASYTIKLSPAGVPGGEARWTVDCPPESPVVLFHADGGLTDPDDPEPLQPGRYLVLVRPSAEPVARQLPGLVFEGRVAVGPVGWPGWSGWEVDLAPGAQVPGYRVAAEAPPLSWEFEPPPESEVAWLESCRVLVGRLPQILVDPVDAFRGAVLEVSKERPAGADENSCYLTLGTDVEIDVENGRGRVDLGRAPGLKDVYGRVRVRCQPRGCLDRPLPALRFLRLPEGRLEYIPDPVRPATAAAVRMTMKCPVAGVVAGPDTELVHRPGEGPATVVLRSTTPEAAPGVVARDPVAGWEVRIRIRVSRGCVVTHRGGFGGWVPLPVPAPDLRTVGLDDQLRVEFHEPPAVEEGRLVSRLPGRGELLVGERLDDCPHPTRFRIELHRWRDGFGVGSSGAVQIRGRHGWVDVATLPAGGPPTVCGGVTEIPPPPPPETWWQRLAVEVDDGVRSGDPASVARLIDRCMDSVRTRAASPAAADVLPVVAARATLAAGWGRDWSDVRAEVDRLADREDLPEAKLLASLLSIREEHRGQRAGEWSHARLDGVKSGLPGTAATDVVLAECWYNYARSAPGPSEECWQSCLRACDRYLDTPGRETGLAFSDALLLRALARLMLDEGPVAERPAAGLLAGHRPWLEAVNLVGHFVRKPWQPGQGSGGGPTLAGPRPTVLRPEDVALIRFAAGLAAGDQGVGQYWPAVQGMADETFFALPLLQARYARLSGDQSRAVEEYNRALAAAAKGKRYRLFELIAEEQP